MTLPSKIKKAIHRKKAIRISLFLLTVLLMTVAIIILENSDFNLFENNIAYKYLIYIVLLVSSFFITKAYLVFTDTNYCGEVKKVNIKSVSLLSSVKYACSSNASRHANKLSAIIAYLTAASSLAIERSSWEYR